MMASGGRDVLVELEFALAEGDAAVVGEQAQHRVLAAALAARHAGPSSLDIEAIGGPETFARSAGQLGALLEELDADEWCRPTIRGLDVQGLVGHLIGVEQAFADAMEGIDDAVATADHVESTRWSVDAQHETTPAGTLAAWRAAVDRSLRSIAGAGAGAGAGDGDGREAPAFYGIALPLDQLLVVRAFETWVHAEDVRTATGRSPAAPDPAALARMTGLVVTLLPAVAAGAGLTGEGGADRTVRLVLTGPGGGTWLVPLDGTAARHPGRADPPSPVGAVIDSVDFCRVVGNRMDPATLLDDVWGEESIVHGLLTGAASLALD